MQKIRDTKTKKTVPSFLLKFAVLNLKWHILSIFPRTCNELFHYANGNTKDTFLSFPVWSLPFDFHCFARENKVSPITCTLFLTMIQHQFGVTHSLAYSPLCGAHRARQHSLPTQAPHLSALTQPLHLPNLFSGRAQKQVFIFPKGTGEHFYSR